MYNGNIKDYSEEDKKTLYFTAIINHPEINSIKKLLSILEEEDKQKYYSIHPNESYKRDKSLNLSRIQRELQKYLKERPDSPNCQRGVNRFSFLRVMAKQFILTTEDQNCIADGCFDIKRGLGNNIYIRTKPGYAERVGYHLRNRFSNLHLLLIADYDSIFIHFENDDYLQNFSELINKYLAIIPDDELQHKSTNPLKK